MIKFLSLSLLAVISFSPLAHAQEDAEAVLQESLSDRADLIVDETSEVEAEAAIAPLAEEEGDYEERLSLSREMHQIWPIRPKIENALDVVVAQIEPAKRLEFKSGMRKAIEYDALEEASVDAMADIFTAKELRAMIDFYGSKEGRSVSHKTVDYEKALLPLMTKMVDKALLDLKVGKQ